MNDRALLVSWLNRGTLHLVRSEDYPWLHVLTTPPLHSSVARRLRQEGVSSQAAERAVAAIERALADEGPLTRLALKERLDSGGVPTAGQALIHLLFLATLRGVVVRGPMIGKQHAFVLVRDWLGAPEPVDRDLALGELARRYLAGHAPAGDRDLARWAGLPLRDARAGLTTIAPELEERDGGLVQLAKHPPQGETPPPRLLGAFDPVLLGWTSREQIIGPHTSLVTRNGIFHPFLLVGGRAVGRWRLAKGQLSLEPFEPLPRGVAAALDAEVADVKRFLALIEPVN